MEGLETDDTSVEMTGISLKDVDFDEGFINSSNLCRILPFHVMVDRKLHVVQCGESLNRRISFANGGQVSGKTGWSFADIFKVIEPDLSHGVTYENILALHKCIFVLEILLKSESADIEVKTGSDSGFKGQLVLRGSVAHIRELDHLVFLARPDVSTFADLRDNDLDLSDIPSHDPTRDLIIWNELYRVEKQEVTALAEKVEKLQREIDDLETEKALSNRLLHSILPPPVADQLRTGNSVEASRYGCVSILFSGICEFGGFCLNCRPIDVVCLLNDLYSQFDDLTQQGRRKVYKVLGYT